MHEVEILIIYNKNLHPVANGQSAVDEGIYIERYRQSTRVATGTLN